MILVIDNYDSFTYNIVQYLSEWEQNVRVFRNDHITADDIEKLEPDMLLISPGPGNPDDAGVSLEAVRRFAGRIPVMGVCLGHQCIGQAFGGKIIRAARLKHGKTSMIRHDGKSIFRSIREPFSATRYHSLLVDRKRLPRTLAVSAWTDEGEIMGLRHRTMMVEGVQFHPESILTENGKKILGNFVAMARAFRPRRQRK